MKAWNITVTTANGTPVGQIGQVYERNESLARAAAACKFAEDGCRPDGDNTSPCIFEDDDFEASPA